MTSRSKNSRARLGTAFVALAIGLGTVAASAPAAAQSNRSYRPSQEVKLSVGEALTADPRVFTGFVQDLTERRDFEAKLEQLKRELAGALQPTPDASGAVAVTPDVPATQPSPGSGERLMTWLT